LLEQLRAAKRINNETIMANIIMIQSTYAMIYTTV
jgi:hypothetical protein